MVVLGVDVTKEELLEIAARAIVEATDTPASNVIRIPDNVMQFAGFVRMSNILGYDTSCGQSGQLLVKRRK
jgi:hypothetical protein